MSNTLQINTSKSIKLVFIFKRGMKQASKNANLCVILKPYISPTIHVGAQLAPKAKRQLLDIEFNKPSKSNDHKKKDFYSLKIYKPLIEKPITFLDKIQSDAHRSIAAPSHPLDDPNEQYLIENKSLAFIIENNLHNYIQYGIITTSKTYNLPLFSLGKSTFDNVLGLKESNKPQNVYVCYKKRCNLVEDTLATEIFYSKGWASRFYNIFLYSYKENLIPIEKNNAGLEKFAEFSEKQLDLVDKKTSVIDDNETNK